MENSILTYIENVTSNPIITLDDNGSILWANKGFEKLYGIAFDKSEKHDCFNKYSDILAKVDYKIFNQVSSLKDVMVIYDNEQNKRWIQTDITPQKDNNGNITGFIVIETDITNQKEIEDELVQQKENAQTISEHLESVKTYIEEQIENLVEQKNVIEDAEQKSISILKKLLPYEIALQLKHKGYSKPRSYNKVTVLHLTIRNIIQLSEVIPLKDLVEQIEEVFIQADNILEQHYVEKIKSAGLVFLGAGGLPLRNRSNPIDVSVAALKIQALFKKTNAERKKKGILEFDITIGINTGQAVAGIVGKNKITYDVWGDSVARASVVEQHAKAGEIILSDNTAQYIEQFFDFIETDCIQLSSNRGEMRLYKLQGLKSEYAKPNTVSEPNELFEKEWSKI